MVDFDDLSEIFDHVYPVLNHLTLILIMAWHSIVIQCPYMHFKTDVIIKSLCLAGRRRKNFVRFFLIS